jgi:hypothetical protein
MRYDAFSPRSPHTVQSIEHHYLSETRLYRIRYYANEREEILHQDEIYEPSESGK